MAALLAAGGLAAGLGAGLTGIAHASDPTRPGKAWNEISLPFDNGKGIAMCVGAPDGSTAAGAWLQLSRCHGYAPNGTPQRWHFSGGRFHQMAAARLSNDNHVPLVALPCDGFQDAAQILELG